MIRAKALSAGIVVVRQRQDKQLYLLLRAYNYWDFPKGIVEKAEDPLQAACREVEEESGIRELDFVWGHDFYQTEPYGSGKVARYYLARTHAAQVKLPYSPELGRPEHDEYRWVTYDEGMGLLNKRLERVLTWAQDRSGAAGT